MTSRVSWCACAPVLDRISSANAVTGAASAGSVCARSVRAATSSTIRSAALCSVANRTSSLAGKYRKKVALETPARRAISSTVVAW
jgi:hypothetical protein